MHLHSVMTSITHIVYLQTKRRFPFVFLQTISCLKGIVTFRRKICHKILLRSSSYRRWSKMICGLTNCHKIILYPKTVYRLSVNWARGRVGSWTKTSDQFQLCYLFTAVSVTRLLMSEWRHLTADIHTWLPRPPCQCRAHQWTARWWRTVYSSLKQSQHNELQCAINVW